MRFFVSAISCPKFPLKYSLEISSKSFKISSSFLWILLKVMMLDRLVDSAEAFKLRGERGLFMSKSDVLNVWILLSSV